MLTRDQLFNSLLYLVPGAKFCFWEDDNSGDTKGYDNLIKIDIFLVSWYPENNDPLPTLEQIQAIDPQVLAANVESLRKAGRDAQQTQNLTMVGLYQAAKISQPELTFSEYLDSLEQAQQNL